MSQPPAGKGRWRKQTLLKWSDWQGTENRGKGVFRRHFKTWRFCKDLRLSLYHRNYRKILSFHGFSREKRVSWAECKEYLRGLRSVEAKQLRKAEITVNVRKKINTCLYFIFFSIYELPWRTQKCGTTGPDSEDAITELLSLQSTKQRARVSRAQCIPFGLLENICHLSGLQSQKSPLPLDLQQLGKFCCANYLGRQHRRRQIASDTWRQHLHQ